MLSMDDNKPCRAVVVACIDYRFFRWLDAFLRSEHLDGAADVVTWPGGGLALADEEGDRIREALAVSMRLHHPSEAILVAHEDCGWFKEREPELDLEDLLRAAGRDTGSRFPVETVRLVLLQMDGTARDVDP